MLCIRFVPFSKLCGRLPGVRNIVESKVAGKLFVKPEKVLRYGWVQDSFRLRIMAKQIKSSSLKDDEEFANVLRAENCDERGEV